MKSANFIDNLGCAVRGIWYALVSQRNMKVHFFAALLVVAVGFLFGLSLLEWAMIVFAIALVWAAEIINTSLEEIVDLVSPDHDKKAGRAKDLGAGAVLVMAVNSVFIGILVLGPHLLQWMERYGH